ncbi:MAG TPA: spirocyclase AveC family protein [Acidimicrobiales bacterium]
MSTTVDAPPGGLRTDLGAAEPKKVLPIRGWAMFGAAMVAIQAWAFTHWIVTGLATPTPTGPDEVPTWMQYSIWAFQGICVVVGAFAIYWYFIRVWRRGEKIGFDSYMVLGMYLTFWQDPLLNYFQKWATYNAGLVNFGSWTSSIPGWLSPDAHYMPEPLLFVVPTYGIVCFLMAVVGNLFMRRMRERHPTWSNPRLLLATLGFFIVFGGAVEMAWMRLGIYAYPGAIKSLTLFAGHYYQYPLYEMFFFAATFTAWSAMRFFRNDRGETVTERGLEELRIKKPPRQVGVIRGLAVIGACNAAMLFIYNAPLQLFAMHSEPWPDDILNRSYLVDQFCGEGTTYACSGTDTPIPRRGGLHVTPDGQLVDADDE